MNSLDFILRCVPAAQERPRHMRTRTGRAMTYKSARQKAHEAELDRLLAPYAPKEPLNGPLEVRFCAYLPLPKRAGKTERQAMLEGKILPTGKPDLDNLGKQLLDSLTRAGFWRDDRQVVLLQGSKAYGDDPCWYVRISEAVA